MSLREFVHYVWWIPLFGCYVLYKIEAWKRDAQIDKLLKDQEELRSKGESK